MTHDPSLLQNNYLLSAVHKWTRPEGLTSERWRGLISKPLTECQCCSSFAYVNECSRAFCERTFCEQGLFGTCAVIQQEHRIPQFTALDVPISITKGKFTNVTNFKFICFWKWKVIRENSKK